MAFDLTDSPHTFTQGSERSKFYMTYARSRPDQIVPGVEQHGVPLLTNAMHRWSDNTDRFLDMWEYDTDHTIDAGGYNVQASFADKSGTVTQPFEDEHEKDEPFYPFTLDEYHEWLSEHAGEVEWASAMDYACEERFDGLWSVEERVKATLDNTLRHYDLEPEYDVLPVLQGRSVDSYVRCFEFLEDHGIPTDYVGLGTICRLSSEKRIVDVERRVRERIGDVRLHGFGVKVAAYKHGASFETADSQAWVWMASNGETYRVERTADGGIRMYSEKESDSLTRTVESFKSYYTYVTWLKHGRSAVKPEFKAEVAS